MELSWKLLGLALCVLAVTADEDYDDDGEKELDMSNVVIPNFLTVAQEISGKLGANISLPCDVDDIGGFIRLWKRQSPDGNQELLFTGSVRLGNVDKRLTLTAAGTLQIENLGQSDAGVYVCQLSTSEPLGLSHTVSVLAPPSVKASKSLIVVPKGQPVTLHCQATGTPKPTITWKRHDDVKKMFDGQESIVGDSITISSVSREHTGSYDCVATNSEGTDKAKVTVDVQYKPEIEVEKTSINSREGYDAELTCTVHAEPKAQVVWMKNSESLSLDDERIKVTKSGSKHLLSIKFVKSSDFGNYSCVAMNTIGETKAVIEVTGKPTAGFTKIMPAADGVKVEYHVESHEMLNEVKIKYKRVDASKWEQKLVKPIHSDVAHVIYNGSVVLEKLISGQMYEVQVSASNTFGWGRESDVQKFTAETAAMSPGDPQDVKGSASVAAASSLLISYVATLLLRC